MGFDDVASAFENQVSAIEEVEEMDSHELETPEHPTRILEHRSSVAETSLQDPQESPIYALPGMLTSEERRNSDTAHFGQHNSVTGT